MKEFVKQHPEHLILSFLLMALIAWSSWVFFSYSSFRNTFVNVPGVPDGKKDGPFKNVTLEQLAVLIDSPKSWSVVESAHPHQIFVARPFVYVAASNAIDVQSAKHEVWHEVPRTWAEKFGLTKKDVLLDLDNDGFTTQEEYLWELAQNKKMDPNNAEVHPDWATKLIYTKYEEQNFEILFKAVTGPNEVQINVKDRGLKNFETKFVSVKDGIIETSDGTYKVVNLAIKKEKVFDPKVNSQVEQDLSELQLIRNDGFRLDLKINQSKPTTVRTAHFTFPLVTTVGERDFSVREGADFTLKSKKYKIDKVDSTIVSIKDTENQAFELKITPN